MADETQTPQSVFQQALSRVQTSLSDVVDTVKGLQPRVGEYFADHLKRANQIVDDLTASAKEVPLTEVPLVVAIETTNRARALCHEIAARAVAYDEQHKVTETVTTTVSSVVEDARTRTTSAFAEASHQLQELRTRVSATASSASATVRDTVSGLTTSSSGSKDGDDAEGKKGGDDDDNDNDNDNDASGSRDVRGVVTDLLVALEDVVHQVSEHERVVAAKAATSAAAESARTRTSELLTAASSRANSVSDKLRHTLVQIASLPPLTLRELRLLATDAKSVVHAATAPSAADPAATEVAADEETKDAGTPEDQQQWASSVTRSLVTVVGQATDALTKVKDAVVLADEEYAKTHEPDESGEAAAPSSAEAGDESGAGAGASSKDASRLSVLNSVRAARSRAVRVVTGTREQLASVATSAQNKATSAATAATDVAMRTAVGVDKRLGVTSVATQLNERLSLTERYAHALSLLSGLDQRLTGGLGGKAVARGQTMAAPGVAFLTERYAKAAEDGTGGVDADADAAKEATTTTTTTTAVAEE